MKTSSYITTIVTKISLLLVTSISLASASEPEYEPIISYHQNSIFAQVGKPVGRLRTQTSNGPSGCTAFLISEKHLMTNEHCIGNRVWNRKEQVWTPRTITSVKVEMGATGSTEPNSMKTYAVRLPPLETNRVLDYAILEFEGNPTSEFGYLSISTTKLDYNMPLWIIGHPKLKPQQISRITCKVIKHPKPRPNRLHHTCPTAGGNSGSPVFDASTGQVIALVYAHYSVDRKDIGLAITMSELAKQSPILSAIINDQ